MWGIYVFYQLSYFLSLNARNAYIQGRREYMGKLDIIWGCNSHISNKSLFSSILYGKNNV
jgi:hypothetical protein